MLDLWVRGIYKSIAGAMASRDAEKRERGELYTKSEAQIKKEDELVKKALQNPVAVFIGKVIHYFMWFVIWVGILAIIGNILMLFGGIYK